MNRFDYIAYDEISQEKQSRIKQLCNVLVDEIAAIGGSAAQPHVLREKALAIEALDIVYARCGRAIRDEQRATRGGKLQEQRNDE